MGARRKARIIALQALYEIDYTGHEAVEALSHLAPEKSFLADTLSFSKELLGGVLQHRFKIDDLIGNFASSFPVEQMPAIDRNILRLAIFEILFNNAPAKVAIDEAVELAKRFGSDSSPRLINGVLGSLSSEYNLIQISNNKGGKAQNANCL